VSLDAGLSDLNESWSPVLFLLGGRETYLVRHVRPTTEESEPRANSNPLSQWLAFGNYPRGVDRRSIFMRLHMRETVGYNP
jgi:hypothetical protein